MKVYRLTTNNGTFYVKASVKEMQEAMDQYVKEAAKTMTRAEIVFHYMPVTLSSLEALAKP